MKGQRFEPACRGGSLLVNETRVLRRGAVAWALWKSQITGVGCVGAIEADTATLSLHLRDGRRFAIEEITPRECLRLFDLLGYEPEVDTGDGTVEAPQVIELGDEHPRVVASAQTVAIEQDSHALWKRPRDRLLGVRVAAREDVAAVQIVERDGDGMHLEGVHFTAALRLLVALGAASDAMALFALPAPSAVDRYMADGRMPDAEALAAGLVRDAQSPSQVELTPSATVVDHDERASKSSSATQRPRATNARSLPLGAAPSRRRRSRRKRSPAAKLAGNQAVTADTTPTAARSPMLGKTSSAPARQRAQRAAAIDSPPDAVPTVEHSTQPRAPRGGERATPRSGAITTTASALAAPTVPAASTSYPPLLLPARVPVTAVTIQAERQPMPQGLPHGDDVLHVPIPPRRDVPDEDTSTRASTPASGDAVTVRQAVLFLWHAVQAAVALRLARERELIARAVRHVVSLWQLAGQRSYAASWRRVAVALLVAGSLLFSDAVPAINPSSARQGLSARPPVAGSALPAPDITGVVYVVSQDGAISALDARSGALLWRYDTGSPVEGGLVVVGGVIYAGEGNGSIVALRAPTHRMLWRYHTGGAVRAAPAVVAGVVYANSSDRQLYALRASDGALLWRFAAIDQLTGTPSVAGGTVYASTSDGTVYALRASNGRLRWRHTPDTRSAVAPVVARGMIHVGTRGASVFALAARYSAPRLRSRADGRILSRPIAVRPS